MSIQTFDWQGYMSDIGYAPEEIPNEINDEDREWLYGLWARDLMEQLNYEARQNPFLATAKEKRNNARDRFLQYAPDLAYVFNVGQTAQADPDKTFDAEEFRQHVIDNPVQNADLGYYLDTFATTRINPDTKYVRPWLDGLSKDQFKRSFMEQQGIDEAWTSVDDIRNGNFGTLAAAYEAQQAQNVPPKSGHMAAFRQGWHEFEKLFGYTVGTLGDAVGINWLSDIGNEIAENVIKKSDAYNYQSKYSQSLADTIKNEGVMAGAGKILNMAEENWATTAAPLALAAIGKILSTYAHIPQPLANAATNAVAANLVRRQGRTLLRRASQLAYGSSAALSGLEIGGVRVELEEHNKYDPENVADVVAAGLVSSSLDFIGNVAAFKGITITARRLFQSRLTTEAARANLAREIAEDQAKSFTHRVLSAALIEGVTEGLQEIPAMVVGARRGIDYTEKEVRDRIIDAAAVGAFMGGGVRTAEIMMEKHYRDDTEEPSDLPEDTQDTQDTPQAPQPPPQPNPPGFEGQIPTNLIWQQTENGFAVRDNFNTGYGASREEAVRDYIKQANKGRVDIDANNISVIPASSQESASSIVRYGDRGQNTIRVTGQGRNQVIRRIIEFHNDPNNVVNLQGDNVFDADILEGLSGDDFRSRLEERKTGYGFDADTIANRENSVDIPVNFDAVSRTDIPGTYAEFNLDESTRDALRSKDFVILSNPRKKNAGRGQEMILYRDGFIYTVSLENNANDERVVARVEAESIKDIVRRKRTNPKSKDAQDKARRRNIANLPLEREIGTQNLRTVETDILMNTTTSRVNKNAVTIAPVPRPGFIEIERRRNAEGEQVFDIDPREILKARVTRSGGKIEKVGKRGITYTSNGQTTRLDITADGRVLVSRDGRFIGDYAFNASDIGGGIERAILQSTRIEANQLFNVIDVPENLRYDNRAIFVYEGLPTTTPDVSRNYYAIKGNGDVEFIPNTDNNYIKRLLALPHIQTLDHARDVFTNQFIEFWAQPVRNQNGDIVGYKDNETGTAVYEANLTVDSIERFSNNEVDNLFSRGYQGDFVKVWAVINPDGAVVRATTEEGIESFINDIKNYANILDDSQWNPSSRGESIFSDAYSEEGRYRSEDLYGINYDDLFTNLSNEEDFNDNSDKIRSAIEKIISNIENDIKALDTRSSKGKVVYHISKKRVDEYKSLVERLRNSLNFFNSVSSANVSSYYSGGARQFNEEVRRVFYRLRTAQAMLRIDLYRNKLSSLTNSLNRTELDRILKDDIGNYDGSLSIEQLRRKTIQAEAIVLRLEEAFVDVIRTQSSTSTNNLLWEAIYPNSTQDKYGSFVDRIHSEGTDLRFSRNTQTPRIRRRRDILSELNNDNVIGTFVLNEMVEKGLRGESGGLRILATQEEAHEIERMFTTSATQPYFDNNGLIQGFVAPDGIIYLVEDGIADGRARHVILHEYGVHAKKFGMTDGEFQEIIQGIKAKRNEQSPDGDFIRKCITRAKEANPKLGEDSSLFWEEVAAYSVEMGYDVADTSIFGRLQAWIKRWLWEFGVIDASTLHYQDLVIFAQGMLNKSGPLKFFDGTHDYTKQQDVNKNITQFSRSILAEDTPERDEFAQRTYRRLRGLDDAIERERNGESADSIEQATDWRRNDSGNWRYDPTRWEPRGVQKQAGVRYPNMGEEISNFRYSIGKAAREEYRAQLEEGRKDFSPEQIENVLKELDKYHDAKQYKKVKAALHWVIRGRVILPEDEKKVEEAIKTAENAEVDLISNLKNYESPLDFINKYKEFKPKAPAIDPTTVPEFSDSIDLGDGIVTYEVQDTREGQQAMREIINTHWGENANPWCLLQGDGKGNLTEDSWEYWRLYNGLPKRVAFKNGKLLSFMAVLSNDNLITEPRIALETARNYLINRPIPYDEAREYGFVNYEMYKRYINNFSNFLYMFNDPSPFYSIEYDFISKLRAFVHNPVFDFLISYLPDEVKNRIIRFKKNRKFTVDETGHLITDGSVGAHVEINKFYDEYKEEFENDKIHWVLALEKANEFATRKINSIEKEIKEIRGETAEKYEIYHWSDGTVSIVDDRGNIITNNEIPDAFYFDKEEGRYVKLVTEEWWDRKDESHPDLDWARQDESAPKIKYSRISARATTEDLKPYKSFINTLENDLVSQRISGVPREGDTVLYQRGDVNEFITRDSLYTIEDADDYYPDLEQRWIDYHRDDSESNFVRYSRSIPETNGFRYSFISEDAARRLDEATGVTTRIDEWRVAKQMENNGANEAEIKMATNWSRGRDGIWRYEISDRWAKVSIPVLRERRAELKQLKEKFTNVRKKVEIDEDTWKQYVDTRNDLIDFYVSITKHDDPGTTTLLSNIIIHGELFRAYPQLREVEFRFVDERNENSIGAIIDDSILQVNIGRIVKDASSVKKIEETIRRTILHEMQHLIQNISGFAQGGNSEMFEEISQIERKKDVERGLDLNRNAFKEFNKLFLNEKNFNSFLKSNPQLTEEEIQDVRKRLFDKFPRSSYPTSLREFVGDAFYKFLKKKVSYKQIPIDDYWSDISRGYNGLKDLQYFLSKSSYDKYRGLLGEIEARVVEQRRSLTSEQLRYLPISASEVQEGIYSTRDMVDPVSLLPLDYIQKREEEGAITPSFNFRYSRATTTSTSEDSLPQTPKQRGTAIPNAPGVYRMPDGSLHIEPSELPVGFENETILYAAISVSDPAKEERRIAELRDAIVANDDLLKAIDEIMEGRGDTNEDHRLGYAVSLILDGYDPASDLYQLTVDAFHEAVSKATGGAYQNLVLNTSQIEAAAHAMAGIPYEPIQTAPQETVPTPRPNAAEVREQRMWEGFDASDAQRADMTITNDGTISFSSPDSSVDVVFEQKARTPFDASNILDKVYITTSQHGEANDLYNHLADSPIYGTQEPTDTGDFALPADQYRARVESFLATVIPNHIWERTEILWDDNAENNAALGGALGVFRPRAYKNKNIIIRGWGRTFGQVVRTAAREASRFGWGLWQNNDFRKALVDFYDMFTSQIHNELVPYYNERGITDPTRLSEEDKIFMVQTFFSKLNQSLFTDDVTDMGDALGITRSEYKRILDRVKSGMSAQEADLTRYMEGLGTDSDLAKSFAQEMLRMTMETSIQRGTQFIYERNSLLGGKDRIRVSINEWGTYRRKIPDTRFGKAAEQIRKNLIWWNRRHNERGEKFARFMMRNFPMSFWGMKWLHLYVPDARLGDTTIGRATQMISRVWQRISDLSGTTIARDYALMETIHGILRKHGYDPTICDDMQNQTYRQFFQSLGITSQKDLDKADLADQVVSGAEQLKKEGAANIRQAIMETGISLYNRMLNEGFSQEAVERMVSRFEAKRAMFRDDYSHRHYEAFTDEGKKELVKMLHYLEREPYMGKSMLWEKVRKAREDLDRARARHNTANAAYYRETTEARRILRRWERLEHLWTAEQGFIVERNKSLTGAALHEQVLNAMKNTIRTIVSDRSVGKFDAQGVPHYNTIAGQKARILNPDNFLHKHLMDFLGEIKDPIMSAVYSLDQQRQILAKLNFNKELGEYLLDNDMADLRGQPNAQGIATDLSEMEYGSFLEYINVLPDFMVEIKNEYENMKKVTETILGGVTDMVKANSTIYSLRLAVNNYVGNTSMLLASGHIFRIGNWLTATDVVRKQFLDRFMYGAKDPSDFAKKIIEEMRTNMVTGGSGTELSAFQYHSGAHENFIRGFTDFLYGFHLLNRSGKSSIDHFAQKALEMARNFYTFGDEWVKPLIYLNNRANAIAKYQALTIRRNGETNEEYQERVMKKAIEKAAEQTIRETVSWENSPFFVRQLSTKSARFFTPDFLLHNFQMLRITASNYVRIGNIISELRNAYNPATQMNAGERDAYISALKKELVQRGIGGSITAGVYAGLAGATGSVMAYIPYMMNSLLSALDGEDDKDKDNTFFNPQEWEGAQRILNYKTGGDNFFVPLFKKDGKLYAWNYGRASVMLTHSMVRPPTENPEFTDYASIFFKNIVNLSNGTIAQEILNNTMGKDKWGREIGMMEGWTRIAERAMVPGAARQLLDMTVGYPGYENPHREGKLIKMSDLGGIVVNAYDMKDIVNELAWDMSRVESNSQNLARRTFVKRLSDSDALSDEQALSLVNDMRESNARDFDKANYLLIGLRQMGMENKEIAHWLTTSRKDGQRIVAKEQVGRFLKGQNVYDTSTLTYLKNKRKTLARGQSDVKMSKEELARVLQNYDKAIRIYSQALRAQ